jgi:2-polyprenyl-3-methyl-5-hydroxy-6-metoxy-1,4-benzoquinol methylase
MDAFGRISADQIMERIRQEVAKRKGGAALSVKPVFDQKKQACERPDVSTIFPEPMVRKELSGIQESASKHRGIYSVHDLSKYHDDEFITNAYRWILKRDPDPQGYGFYITKLRQGARKGEILGMMRYSREGRQCHVAIRGLLPLFMVDRLFEIPILGYLLEVAASIAMLPTRLKYIRQWESFTNRRLEQQNNATSALSSGFESNAMQLQNTLKAKADTHVLNEIRDRLSTKADAGVLHELQRRLETKADSRILVQVKEQLTTKADVELLENIWTQIANKADNRSIAEVRKDLATKADQAAVNGLKGQLEIKADSRLVEQIRETLLTKADVDLIDRMRTQISNKAGAHTVEALREALATKADSEVVERLQEQMTAKADADAIGEIRDLMATKADAFLVEEIRGQLATKAEASIADEVREQSATRIAAVVADIHRQLSAKADADAVGEVRDLMATKADAFLVEEIRGQLATKAEAGIADEVREQSETRITAVVADIHRQLSAKADAEALDALKADLAHKVDSEVLSEISGELQHLARQTRDHKLYLLDQQRRLSKLLEEARKRFPEPMSAQQLEGMINEEDHLLDALYSAFEDQFRGTREDIKQRLSVYLPYIEKLTGNSDGAVLLDLGCGRGEWLELLRENSYPAKGVDQNRVMIHRCSEMNLDVIESDAIAYLKNQQANRFKVITGFHIVEHIPFKAMLDLLDESLRLLTPGGMIIFETPNPENLIVGSCNFYLDPTHRRPIPPPQLLFMVEQRGFVKAQILRLHPFGEFLVPPSDSGYNEKIRNLFSNAQDYSVIAYKPLSSGGE